MTAAPGLAAAAPAAAAAGRPIRILHVVGGMNRGGVETWLMHVLRNIDREQYRMDFLVHTDRPCAYDDEIRALGSMIIPCLHPHRPWRFAKNFRKALRDHGPYDVVHSHLHHYSGFVLRLAALAGVLARIAHSHSDTAGINAKANVARRSYLALMETWIDRYATAGLACSAQAASALYGPDWWGDARWRVLHCGIDLAPFSAVVDRRAVRREFGLPEDAFVVGHVGRFVEAKNHAFLIDVAAEVVRREPRARFLLVGDGPLRPAIEDRARRLGVAGRIVFAGECSNVPRIMIGAFDVFLFPSVRDGISLVVIEAQAAGVFCVCSHALPVEADVEKSLVQRLALSEPVSTWADAVLSTLFTNGLGDRAGALAAVRESSFEIRNSMGALLATYDADGA